METNAVESWKNLDNSLNNITKMRMGEEKMNKNDVIISSFFGDNKKADVILKENRQFLVKYYKNGILAEQLTFDNKSLAEDSADDYCYDYTVNNTSNFTTLLQE